VDLANFLRNRLRPILGLALAVAVVAGCSDDPTGSVEDVDAEQTAQAMESVVGSFESNEALQSFTVLGNSFGTAFGSSPTVVQATSAPGVLGALEALSLRAAHSSLEPHSASLMAVLPESVLGTTFVYDPEQFGYVASELEGAPENGVRFILYAVNPISGEIQEEVEIGHTDLLDTSTETENRLRAVVVSGEVTYIDYEVSCGFVTGGVGLSGVGFLTDGTTRANLDLNLSADQSTGEVVIDFDVDVPSESLEIRFDGAIGAAEESVSMSFEIVLDGNSIAFDVSADGEALTGDVRFNGTTVAVISGSFDAPVVTDAEGGELTLDQRQQLAQLFDGAGETIEAMIGLLSPAFGVCFTVA
jgi:hypothetical protein